MTGQVLEGAQLKIPLCSNSLNTKISEAFASSGLLLRTLLKQNTALLSTVRVFVTGVTSHISHIYKGINAMLIIWGPMKPYKF